MEGQSPLLTASPHLTSLSPPELTSLAANPLLDAKDGSEVIQRPTQSRKQTAIQNDDLGTIRALLEEGVNQITT